MDSLQLELVTPRWWSIGTRLLIPIQTDAQETYLVNVQDNTFPAPRNYNFTLLPAKVTMSQLWTSQYYTYMILVVVRRLNEYICSRLWPECPVRKKASSLVDNPSCTKALSVDLPRMWWKQLIWEVLLSLCIVTLTKRTNNVSYILLG